MQCTKCGKTFASHTDRPEICWDCYMKDINNYQVTNTPNEAAKYKDHWETFDKDFKGFADNAAEINRLTEKLILETKADTVKKMQKKIRAKSEYGTINISSWQLDQIAKEMLEEDNGIY